MENYKVWVTPLNNWMEHGSNVPHPVSISYNQLLLIHWLQLLRLKMIILLWTVLSDHLPNNIYFGHGTRKVFVESDLLLNQANQTTKEEELLTHLIIITGYPSSKDMDGPIVTHKVILSISTTWVFRILLKRTF